MKLNFSLDKLSFASLRRKRTQDDSCSPPIAKLSRDWIVLLLLSAAVLLVCALFSTEEYFGARDQEATGPQLGAPAEARPAFDRAALTELLVQFGARRDAHARLLSQPPALPDPARALPAKSQ